MIISVFVMSEQTATFSLYIIKNFVVDKVYSAVRTDSLYRAFHNVLRDYKHL